MIPCLLYFLGAATSAEAPGKNPAWRRTFPIACLSATQACHACGIATAFRIRSATTGGGDDLRRRRNQQGRLSGKA